MESSDEFVAPQHRMIVDQLRSRGIKSEAVLNVMMRVPRDQFVPVNLKRSAYSDQALPIDCEQTVSQPYIVALMTEALELTGDERVLEIGTGSGYQTAILAELASQVFTVERHAKLQAAAELRLERLGFDNVQFRIGDGHYGWPEYASFDRIIVTAAARSCPPALKSQLVERGILVGPFGPSESQNLQVIHNRRGFGEPISLTPCRFVPLVNEQEQSNH